MAINVYEGMFIFDSGRYGRDPEGVAGEIAKMVEKAGGEILVSRLWEERRLAYPINGQKKGTYWLTYFRVEGQQLPTITRQSELNDNVLRSLLLKVDPRIVDALVAHATGATAKPAEDAKTEAGKSTSEDAKSTSEEGKDLAGVAADSEKSADE